MNRGRPSSPRARGPPGRHLAIDVRCDPRRRVAVPRGAHSVLRGRRQQPRSQVRACSLGSCLHIMRDSFAHALYVGVCCAGNISRRTSSTLPRPILTCRLQSRLGQIGIRLSAAGTCATDQRRSRSATSARRRSSSASIFCETCALWDCASSPSPFAPRRVCRASGNLDSSSGRI